LFLITLLGWRISASLRHLSPGSSTDAGPAAAPSGGGTEEQRLLDAAARQPTDQRVHRELAQVYTGQGRVAEALWEYQEAAALRPEAVAIQVDLARALGQLRLHDLAIAQLEERLSRQPGAVELRDELAELYLATGRPERAAAVLAADRQGVHASPAALLILGRTERTLGRLEAARAAFQEHLRRSPQSVEGHYWLGRVTWVLGRAQVARLAWEQAARLAPEDPRFPCCLGMSYAHDRTPGSVDSAGQAFNEALRRSPDYVPALVQLGLLYQRHGRYREAVNHFLKAIDAGPTDPEPHRHLSAALAALGEGAEAHRQLGLYYSLRDQPVLAIAEYERFQAAAPAAIDGPLLISQSYSRMQQHERATTVVGAALRRHPREPALTERLVTLYILTYSRTEAVRTCEAWLKAQPEATRPRWLLGRAALSNQRVDEAIQQFEAALARDPNDAEYAFALGGALARNPTEANLQRAVSLLRRAVALNRSAPDYHQQLGVTLQQVGQPEAARREFLATLSLDPDRSAAYNGLTQVSQELRHPHQVTLWARAMRAVQERLREEQRQRREAGHRRSKTVADDGIQARPA